MSINNLFEKIEWRISGFLDKISHWYELRKWNKKIIKQCKKNYMADKKLKIMYKNIQKNLLQTFRKNDPERTVFVTVMLQKIYSLNKEFINLDKEKFNDSSIGLTRQMIEIYIRLIQARIKPKMKNKIIKEERQKGGIRNVVDNLKKAADIPYIKNSSKEFLKWVYNKYKDFSNLFHLSGINLTRNLWIYNKKENETRSYLENPNLKENEILLSFSEKPVVTKEEIFNTLHTFYTFTSFCIEEIGIIEEDEK
ncbi:MAG: hypothetical protein ACOCRX_06990 [Candidatus Woesearchaeota archaeon]